MKKRIVSLLLALVMVLSLVPTTVWAAENHDGQVRVIVENTTYAKADGAAWDGTLVDKWVDLVPGSTMMERVCAMRILVLSDSHGCVEPMEQCVERVQPQVILHLGDCVRDAQRLEERYPDIPLLGVPGNCDYGGLDQPERLTELGGVRILMMHGHTRRVKSGPMAAIYAARECGADILLFGHTHQPVVDRSGDFWVMNPGCIGPSVRRTYGVITLEDGKVDCAAFRL